MASAAKQAGHCVEDQQGKAARDEKRTDITNLDDRYSSVCPGCRGTLDFWACEALCHYCGLKFTCDE